MSRKRLNLYLSYALALLTVTGVLMFRLLLERLGLISGSSFLLFSVAVVIASLYGGFGPGLAAAVFAAFVIDYFFLEPLYTIDWPTRRELLPLLLFLAQGSLISWLAGAKKGAVEKLSSARNDLEREVELRTAELKATNAALTHQVRKNRQMTEDLRNFAEQLQRSHSELQDFASIASLDLQAPLRKVHEFAERLKTQCSTSLPTEGKDYIDRIQLSATRMSGLLSSLITFSRVTSKAQPFQPIDLNRVVEDVLSDLEPQINNVGATVDIGPLQTISGDPMHLRRLFSNLLSNAIKFRREDVPLHVTIRSRFVEEDRSCEITIEDNGRGIDEKHLDKIFNIFHRLHDHPEFDGSGVGLAICRKIVELHGGSIVALSTRGQGSTFAITLPGGAGEAAADAAGFAPAPAGNGAP